MTDLHTMLTLKGRGNKRGCAIGKTEYLRKREHLVASPSGDPRREAARLKSAINASREELLELHRRLAAEAGESEAWIFLMQIYLLDGSLFSGTPSFYIAEGKSADESVLLSHDAYLCELSRNGYVRDISEDVRDVTARVMRHLSQKQQSPQRSENFILLSISPTPSQIYELSDSIIGIVASECWEGTTAAALARSLFIPAVLTDKDFGESEARKNAIIDSLHGVVYIDPDLNTVEEFTASRTEHPMLGTSLQKRSLPLLAKTDSLLEASRIHETDLDGIGLFRSEELYLRSVAPPDEEMLFDAYCALAESLLPRPLVIRTFSVSGMGSVRINKLTAEGKSDPELYVFHDETLTRQLRATLRAAVFGRVALAAPCGASYDTLRKIKELITILTDELRRDGRDCREVPLGAIIDSPASAIACDKILDASDFGIVKRDALSLCEPAGEISRDAERILLERVARTAKRKKKPLLLCLKTPLYDSESTLAKKLGFAALIISPDDTESFV